MNFPAPVNVQTSATALSGQPCFVRVTGTLEGRFVEFEFSIGEPDMAVALVMLFDQFRDFCDIHQATHLTADESARLDWERMKWRYGAPGIDH